MLCRAWTFKPLQVTYMGNETKMDTKYSKSEAANTLIEILRTIASNDELLRNVAEKVSSTNEVQDFIAQLREIQQQLYLIPQNEERQGWERAVDKVNDVEREVAHPDEDRGAVDPRNKLNELTGGEWLYFTKSTITTAYPKEYGHEVRKQHGANKPPQLMKELIEFFSKSDGIVLDPFAGVGGTLIGASICRNPRKCIGIEINQKWVDIYNKVCEIEGIEPQDMQVGDCLVEMQNLSKNSIDFIATDPPYNIHLGKTMSGDKYADEFSNRRTDYNMQSDKEGDVANAENYPAYLDTMENIFEQCCRVLKPKGYMVVILRNAYQDSRYILTNADLAEKAQNVGFVLKGEKIWYQAGTRLRPYGYPYAYVPNITHQFIMIFRKGK